MWECNGEGVRNDDKDSTCTLGEIRLETMGACERTDVVTTSVEETINCWLWNIAPKSPPTTHCIPAKIKRLD